MQQMANVNGKITPIDQAKISILDRGFQYGDSIYEVTRTYDGVPFFLEEHFDRLENSARLSKIQLSQSRSQLTSEIKKTVEACAPFKKGDDVFIRYTITRGEGPLDLDPAVVKKTSFVILVKEVPQWNKNFYEYGVKLAVPSIRRNSPLCLDPNIKSGNYLNNILAVAEAKQSGADDALMLSIDNKLTEASNSNIVFVINGDLHSPLHQPLSHTGNLKGITKTLIAELAAENNLVYQERIMTLEDISNASECFVSSATREVMPVQEINILGGEKLRFSLGGITKKIQHAYTEYVHNYVLQNKKTAWF